jgi:hypothetical protein
MHADKKGCTRMILVRGHRLKSEPMPVRPCMSVFLLIRVHLRFHYHVPGREHTRGWQRNARLRHGAAEMRRGSPGRSVRTRRLLSCRWFNVVHRPWTMRPSRSFSLLLSACISVDLLAPAFRTLTSRIRRRPAPEVMTRPPRGRRAPARLWPSAERRRASARRRRPRRPIPPPCPQRPTQRPPAAARPRRGPVFRCPGAIRASAGPAPGRAT